jgi:hypothetical protein
VTPYIVLVAAVPQNLFEDLLFRRIRKRMIARDDDLFWKYARVVADSFQFIAEIEKAFCTLTPFLSALVRS